MRHALVATACDRSTNLDQCVCPDEIPFLQLLKEGAGHEPIDLRGLMISLLDQGEETLNLDELMKTLQSLFQKNQIGIRLSIIGQS